MINNPVVKQAPSLLGREGLSLNPIANIFYRKKNITRAKLKIKSLI